MMHTKKIGFLIVLALLFAALQSKTAMADEGRTAYLPLVVSPTSPIDASAIGVKAPSAMENMGYTMYIPLVASPTSRTVMPGTDVEVALVQASSEITEVCKRLLATPDPPYKNLGECVSIQTLTGLDTGKTFDVVICKNLKRVGMLEEKGFANLGQCIKSRPSGAP